MPTRFVQDVAHQSGAPVQCAEIMCYTDALSCYIELPEATAMALLSAKSTVVVAQRVGRGGSALLRFLLRFAEGPLGPFRPWLKKTAWGLEVLSAGGHKPNGLVGVCRCDSMRAYEG